MRTVAAIVCAAGQSSRMGESKLSLPWGNTTILGQVLQVLAGSGLENIFVITGAWHDEIEAIANGSQAKAIFNQDYPTGEMLSSIQCGLRNLPPSAEAALVALGDQPQIKAATVGSLLEAHFQQPRTMTVPSVDGRRGHPWILPRNYWQAVLSLEKTASMRDFFRQHSNAINLVDVLGNSPVEDVDTYDQYLKARPHRATVRLDAPFKEPKQ